MVPGRLPSRGIAPPARVRFLETGPALSAVTVIDHTSAPPPGTPRWGAARLRQPSIQSSFISFSDSAPFSAIELASRNHPTEESYHQPGGAALHQIRPRSREATGEAKTVTLCTLLRRLASSRRPLGACKTVGEPRKVTARPESSALRYSPNASHRLHTYHSSDMSRTLTYSSPKGGHR